jgi:O-antigen/teichoic acid export membrane protein
VLIVAFVLGGLSIDGALAGVVVASAIELIVARRFVQPGLSHASHVEAKALWNYALPLFAAAASLRMFDKLDLFVLKALGGSATLAGVYGAAQNLTIIPNLIALSVTTLLLSTLSRALRSGDSNGARQLATNALRGVLVLFPFAGVAAGAATGLATLIYGREFADTGPLLAVLIFAALAVVMISVASSILTAIGKPTWAMWATLPVAPLALAGHLAVIPRLGATGATYVTLGVATLGASGALAAVHRAWRVAPPAATALRVTLVTVAATAVGVWWRTNGLMVVVELVVMSVVVVALLVASGERVQLGAPRFGIGSER